MLTCKGESCTQLLLPTASWSLPWSSRQQRMQPPVLCAGEGPHPDSLTTEQILQRRLENVTSLYSIYKVVSWLLSKHWPQIMHGGAILQPAALIFFLDLHVSCARDGWQGGGGEGG